MYIYVYMYIMYTYSIIIYIVPYTCIGDQKCRTTSCYSVSNGDKTCTCTLIINN